MKVKQSKTAPLFNYSSEPAYDWYKKRTKLGTSLYKNSYFFIAHKRLKLCTTLEWKEKQKSLKVGFVNGGNIIVGSKVLLYCTF